MKSFLLTLSFLTISHGLAQTNTPKISPHRVNDNLYVLKGGSGMGSHVGVIIGQHGLLLIDAMMEESFPKLLTAIRQISDKPIRFVINTHGDFDHTGGNAKLAEMGATIITQANARYDYAVHTMTFKEELIMTFGDEEIQVHPAVSHSPTDLIIYLPKSNVLFMGDVVEGGSLPSFFAGGKSGFDKAINRAMAYANRNTLVVPGHGPFMDKSHLFQIQLHTANWVAQIGKMYRAGKSANEMIGDPEMLRLVTQFDPANPEPYLKPRRLGILTKRIINTDFVAPFDLIAENFDAYVGNYHYPDNELLELVVLDDRLIARIPGKFLGNLIPLSQTHFHLRGHIGGKQFTFQFDSAGSVTGLLDLEGEQAKKQP